MILKRSIKYFPRRALRRNNKNIGRCLQSTASAAGDEKVYEIKRELFGQSGTIKINIDHDLVENNAQENDIIINTVWSDSVEIKISSKSPMFDFNDKKSESIVLSESGSMESNSSQIDLDICSIPSDAPFLLEIHMPEHSNFSFISHVSDLHTNVTIPRKLEGDVHVETTKGDIEVNKIRGELIHLETSDGEFSAASAIEGRQFIAGNNVKAKRLMGEHVYVETSFDPYYQKNNTATTVPENPTDGNIDIDALYGGQYHLMSSYFGNVNVGTVQGGLKVQAYNKVNIAGVDGNVEVSTTNGDVHVHFDQVGKHETSSIFCPNDDYGNLSVSVNEGEDADIIVATNCSYDLPLGNLIVNKETEADDEKDIENKVEGYIKYFDGTLTFENEKEGGDGAKFESGKIRTSKETGWSKEDEDDSNEKERARIFLIGGMSAKVTVESWMDRIKKKYAMDE